jgi:hypothetical protein
MNLEPLRALLRSLWPGVDVAAEQDRRVMALARDQRPGDPQVAAAWGLLLYGFEHQGRPTGNLAVIVGMLDRTNRVGGWDEFGIDEVAGQRGQVEVWFLDESATCDRAALLAEVTALRVAMTGG